MAIRTTLVAALASLTLATGCKSRDSEKRPAPAPETAVTLTHGVASGAVTARSALLWARASGDATLVAEVSRGETVVARGEVAVTAATDHTGIIAITSGLEPGTGYRYAIRARRGDGQSPPVAGSFLTAPAASDARPVRFGYSGDLAGQNVCRDKARGFPIFEPINAAGFDFFIALGDMIYADGVCEKTGAFGNAQVPGDFGPSTAMPAFWAHWKYNRLDPGYQRLLSSMAVYATWDDHETINDSGPAHDTRATPPYQAGAHLLPLGLAAFRHYNPVSESDTIHSSQRWGRQLELFFLDNRSYRDANNAADTDAAPKTMLGAEQRAWLEAGLRDSDATWQIVVSSVPISIPTGNSDPVERDGWADFGSGQGFERELRAILAASIEKRVPNLLWITTDVHFASVFRYRLDDAGAHFHEAVVGPLSAGLYPTRDADETFGTERLLFHGPDSTEGLSYDDSLAYMTYGDVTIDAAGVLTLRIVDATGKTVFEKALPPRLPK